MLSLGLPPEDPPLAPSDELLLGKSVLGMGTPAADAPPPALGIPKVDDELPPAPPDEPELPPAFAPPDCVPPWLPAAPPLCPL
jgi:hypothetical protein